MLFLQKGKCAEYVLGVRVMCMCLSGDVLYVGLSSGSVLLIDLQVQVHVYMYMCTCTCMHMYMYYNIMSICLICEQESNPKMHYTDAM
jgi:hypothetical protein